MAYVIIVGSDNSLYGSQKCKIMQKEKLFNKLWFLVAPHYNGYDMSECTVTMRYMLPISKEFRTETLVLSEERYEEYLKYELPLDTCLTKEWGDVEMNLTFTMLDSDEYGNAIQRVRKTENHVMIVTKIPDWDAVIPDAALSALDQRILKQDAQIKALKKLTVEVSNNKVDNLVYDSVEETLQLTANGVGVGDKVSVKNMIDDGIPVVDFGYQSDNEDFEQDDNVNCEHEDNVVEI